MFINTVSLGSNLSLQLLFNENNNLTPTSALIRVYTPQVASPYFAQVGADLDVLTSGAEISTGLWGIRIDTSSYIAGQYSLYLEWVSPVTGFTYSNNASFNVAADNAAVISRIDTATAQISKIPYPDNRAIKAIAETLGIKDTWNERYLAMVMDTNEFSKNMTKTMSTISMKMDNLGKALQLNEKTLKSSTNDIKSTMLKDMFSSIKKELSDVVNNISMKSEELNNSVTKKDDLYDSFDLYSKQMVALFQKVNIVMDQISELSAKIDDMNLTLPSMVAEENANMATAAAKQMITEQFRTGQTRL